MGRLRVGILGSTRLARVVVAYALERRGARIVSLDPGDEDEGLPWFAPIRGLARDNGLALGRADADLLLDCDPDARPVDPEGIGLRVLAPARARSPDLNRMLLDGGEWRLALTRGPAHGWVSEPLGAGPDDDADALLDAATLVALELLDRHWDALVAGEAAPALAAPLRGGRWRPQEATLLWEQPADRVVARVRACAGPYGGARAWLGDTPVRILDARTSCAAATPDWAPGTIVSVGPHVTVATGRGTIEVQRIKPSWRPARGAAALLAEIGVGPGYLLA